ncbi:hypothetical protein LBMAG42_41960 [Deltaproteobacteria bacterium]|nr:hypothetical protein LBMAG42_41960 [Deltaproteobacteria bacterium]
MSHEHERPVEPFSDLHVEHEHVRATLLHDPTVEGLDVALYLDGSGSMAEDYRESHLSKGGGILYELFGWGEEPSVETIPNRVEPQARWMLEYLASKDRNGKLRVAYWACGNDGRRVETVGELAAADAKRVRFQGPKHLGQFTVLTPALNDFLTYFDGEVKKGARQGCCVIITDGAIHDAEEVKIWSRKLAAGIGAGRYPRVNLILVGVGHVVKEEQLEDICHEEYPGIGHLWCHRIAEEIKNVAELVAALVDETMTVAAGGTITDDKGRVVKRYEGRLPAVLEFEVPEGCTSFTLEVGGRKYTQPLPEEGEEHEEEEGHH